MNIPDFMNGPSYTAIFTNAPFCFRVVVFKTLTIMARATGLVIYRKFHEEIQYLLLQTSDGIHHWTPPKGHVHKGESDRETALRETEEESGLRPDDLKIVWDFEKKLEYLAHKKHKEVIYYLAELKYPETPVKLSDEHKDFKWLSLPEACKIAEYQEMEHLFQEADKYILNCLTTD